MSQLTKSALRKIMAESLKDLSEANKRSQSEYVAAAVYKHPRYKSARKISLYLSTANEIDTLKILKQALELDKKQCFIPLVRKSRQASGTPRMRMVEIKSMQQYESMPVNKYGIKEPLESEANLNEAHKNELDLILVPGVAFASDGRRLGHGKGYYDEYLAHLSCERATPPYCIGLALREQIVQDPLAQAGHDYVLDEILVAPSE